MAATIKVQVDGALKETPVQSFSYSIMNGMTGNGKNSGEPRSGLMSFRLPTTSDETKLAEWACTRTSSRYKKVTVKFYESDGNAGTAFRTIEFEKAFVVRFQEDYANKEPFQVLDISAEKVKVGGGDVNNDWDNKGV